MVAEGQTLVNNRLFLCPKKLLGFLVKGIAWLELT